MLLTVRASLVPSLMEGWPLQRWPRASISQTQPTLAHKAHKKAELDARASPAQQLRVVNPRTTHIPPRKPPPNPPVGDSPYVRLGAPRSPAAARNSATAAATTPTPSPPPTATLTHSPRTMPRAKRSARKRARRKTTTTLARRQPRRITHPPATTAEAACPPATVAPGLSTPPSPPPPPPTAATTIKASAPYPTDPSTMGAHHGLPPSGWSPNVAVAERVQRAGLTVDDWLACVHKTHPTERLADTGPSGSHTQNKYFIAY